jgi:hypothetical protein
MSVRHSAPIRRGCVNERKSGIKHGEVFERFARRLKELRVEGE